MRLFTAIIATFAALFVMPASAKVYTVPQAPLCMIGDTTIKGVNPAQCKLLNDLDAGKIVKGCVVSKNYVRELSEDACYVIDGTWTYVRE